MLQDTAKCIGNGHCNLGGSCVGMTRTVQAGAAMLDITETAPAKVGAVFSNFFLGCVLWKPCLTSSLWCGANHDGRSEPFRSDKVWPGGRCCVGFVKNLRNRHGVMDCPVLFTRRC